MPGSRDQFYAHSLPDRPESEWQPLEDHLHRVAKLAADCAASFDSREWGWFAGLWHDIGKYSREFQLRISAGGGDDAHIERIGRVDHSTAGAKHAENQLKGGGFGKALAYTIAGHHSGLPDGISTDSCLRSRLDKEIPDYSACPQSILRGRDLTLPLALDRDRAAVQISTFIRMLYSALVDADFLDTERFVDKGRAQSRRGYRTLQKIADDFSGSLQSLQEAAPDTRVNRRRQDILEQCLAAADKETGLFSLTVPTGGGKTLSSMAFALKHALRHGLERVIYVIPFTSIIEQNADVFRQMCGDEAILEHHSNFEPDEEDRRSRLAAENWDAPIVVTTNVQFFESLFANRSSRCRKLHNIAKSVVVLDEVQCLPAPYLLPCLEVLKEIVDTYGSTIVLCSATQPAVQKKEDFARGLEGVREIVRDPQELATTLKRVQVSVFSRTPDAELAGRIAKQKQVLCIVNTRRHARDLYRCYSETYGACGLYHLSALMCPVHRSQKLAEIRQRLGDGQICHVVSTQLVEAGVDIDFPVVYRAMAGLDSIAQAAGRCNREGRLRAGQVVVFEPEAGMPAGHFRQTAQAAESVVRRYGNDVLSLAAIEDYFRQYYWVKGEGLDEEGILAMLQAGCKSGDFPFKTVAEKFRFIKSDMKPIIIPFDSKAHSLVETLEYCDHPASIARRLQRYTVNIYPDQWERLRKAGSIELKADMFPVLIDESLYRDDRGLVADDPNDRDPESLFA